MPDVDLTSSTAVLASVALIGIFIILILAITLVIPGLIISIASTESKVKLDLLDILFPTGLASIAIFVSWYSFDDYVKHLTFLSAFLISISVVILAVKKALSSEIHGPPRKLTLLSTKIIFNLTSRRFHIIHVLSFSLWIIFSSILFFVFAKLYVGQNGEGEWVSWMMFAVWLFWMCASTSMVGTLDTTKKYEITAGISLCSIYILFMLSSNPTAISVAVMKALGLGEINNVTLVVTKSGCEAVRTLLADKYACESENNDTTAKTQPVTIKSRIGSQYLIEYTKEYKSINNLKKKIKVRAVIKRDDVLGWSKVSESNPPSK
jgi:hypothetical protein